MSYSLDPNMAANQASSQDIQARTRAVQSLSGGDNMSDAERSKRLREACEGFEAVFIQKMWEQMRATLPKEGFLKSKAEEFWQGMYDQELGKSMASSGGIGLADMMVQQLDRNQQEISSASHFSASRPAMHVPPSPVIPAEVAGKLGMPGAETVADKSAEAGANAQPAATAASAVPVGMSIYDGEAEQPEVDAFGEDTLSGADLEAAVTAEMYQNMENSSATDQASRTASAVSQTLDELASLALAQQQAAVNAPERNRRGMRESTAPPVNVQLKFQQMTGQAPYHPAAAVNVPVVDDVLEAKTPGVLPLVEQAAGQTAQLAQGLAQETAEPQPVVTRITYQTNLPPSQRKASPFQNGMAQQILQSAANVANPRGEMGNELSTADSPTRKSALAQPAPAAAPAAPVPAPAPETVANVTPAAVETDILAGIKPRFISSRLQASLSGEAQNQSTPAEVTERPFQAGGQSLRRPEAVNASMPLGNPAPAGERLTAPVSGEISSGFGWRIDPFTGERGWHPGVDIKAMPGEVVRSAMPGVVTFAGQDSELGNLVIVDHGDGLTTRYGHNQTMNVQVGQKVSSGMELARAGASGRAAGPHVHFEVRRGTLALNPEPLLRQG